MEEIIISMEATCDLPKEIIEKHNFQIVNMDFMINDEVYSTGTDNVKSTNLYEKTGDISLCAKQLNHKNISTTQRYAEISKKKQKEAANTLDNMFTDI